MTSRSFGETIEDYKVGSVIGKGGFSSVHWAKCLKTSVDVAIKMLLFTLKYDKEIMNVVILITFHYNDFIAYLKYLIDKKAMDMQGMLDRVYKEVDIHSRLKNPNILQVHTFFQDNKYVYLILELCKVDLQKYLVENGNVLKLNEAKRIVRQVVNGLLFLHSHNIVHRDIKLSNLLLTDDMTVKIADFGLATQLSSIDDRHMTMCGTPNYISPEVVTRATHGLEADVWGVGCLLYTLLVGQPPFEMDTIKSTLNKVVNVDYHIPSHVSPEAADLIIKLLKRDPYHRLKLSHVLSHPFFNMCSSPPKCWRSEDFLDSGCGLDTLASNSTEYNKYNSLDRNGSFRPHKSMETPRTLKMRNLSVDRRYGEDKITDYAPDFRKNIFVEERKHYSAGYPSDNYGFAQGSNLHHRASQNNSNPVEFRSNSHTYENFSRGNALGEYSNKFSEPSIKFESNCASNFCATRNCGTNINNWGENSKCVNRECSRCKSDQKRKHDEALESATLSPIEPSNLIEVETFSTKRLKPTRYKSKNIALTITDNGEVCVEFLRTKSRTNQELVMEVCRISPDGLRMKIYYPNDCHGIPVTDEPPAEPREHCAADVNCRRLSRENWKKYSYASRFVDMVRAKTPKVTLYTDKCKGVLMENLPDPDFELHMYSGAKVMKSQKGIKLTDNEGNAAAFTDVNSIINIKPPLQRLYACFQRCYAHCRNIEKNLSAVATTDECLAVFPAIIGRKVTASSASDHYKPPFSPNIFHSTEYGVT